MSNVNLNQSEKNDLVDNTSYQLDGVKPLPAGDFSIEGDFINGQLVVSVEGLTPEAAGFMLACEHQEAVSSGQGDTTVIKYEGELKPRRTGRSSQQKPADDFAEGDGGNEVDAAGYVVPDRSDSYPDADDMSLGDVERNDNGDDPVPEQPIINPDSLLQEDGTVTPYTQDRKWEFMDRLHFVREAILAFCDDYRSRHSIPCGYFAFTVQGIMSNSVPSWDQITLTQENIDGIQLLEKLYNLRVAGQITPVFMLLFREQKKQRKQKDGVRLGLLTPGTTFHYDLTHIYHNDDSRTGILTVKSLIQNGVDSYCVQAEEMHLDPCYSDDRLRHISFNICNITHVVQHVPGKLVFGGAYSRDYAKTLFAYDGHKRKYSSMSCGVLIPYLTDIMGLGHSAGEAVDTDAMRLELIRQNLFTPLDKGGRYRHHYNPRYASKKKLRRAVRQLFNKFKVSKQKRFLEEREEQRRDYENDFGNYD